MPEQLRRCRRRHSCSRNSAGRLEHLRFRKFYLLDAQVGEARGLLGLDQLAHGFRSRSRSLRSRSCSGSWLAPAFNHHHRTGAATTQESSSLRSDPRGSWVEHESSPKQADCARPPRAVKGIASRVAIEGGRSRRGHIGRDRSSSDRHVATTWRSSRSQEGNSAAFGRSNQRAW